MLEEDYPYKAQDGFCRSDKLSKTTELLVDERFNVRPFSVEHLKAAVAKQPIAVAVEGYQDVFVQYKTGIFDSKQCGTKLDHAVVLVGFGVDPHSEIEYWILRNDWGTSWGEDGYMRLKM